MQAIPIAEQAGRHVAEHFPDRLGLGPHEPDRLELIERNLTPLQRRGWELDPPDARGFYPWLALLAGPLWMIASGSTHPRWVASLGLAAYAIAWVATIHYAFVRRSLARIPLAIVLVGALGLGIAYGGLWGILPASAGIACGVALMGKEIGVVALPFAALTAIFAWLSGDGWGDVASLTWGTLTSAFIPWMIMRLFAVIHELRATRERLAEVAVEQERARFSRDMHDLLGHSLSVMVVKAEAVRRLLPGNPDAAIEQAADIEQLGRQALVEVRAAVTGYRGRGLNAELDSARAALADAGIEPTVRVAAGPLAPEADALLGWAVREGVTNVIRHSGADSCHIEVVVGPKTTLEIRDNGSSQTPPGLHGNGLLGLRERVEAQGGDLHTGPRPDGGFELRVRTPNEPKPAADALAVAAS
jgi:two-component system sensor histidine kinase DesK